MKKVEAAHQRYLSAAPVKQDPSKHVNLNTKEERVEKWNFIFKTPRISPCTARVFMRCRDDNLTNVVRVRGTTIIC